MGDWLSGVAAIALLIERSGARAGTAVALYALIRHLPLFLLGPAAGIAADRLDRRRLLIAADILRAGLALAYLIVWAGGPLWVLYATTAGLAGVSIFFNTARGALLPTIATRSQLMVANALSAATFGTTLAVGSLIGGVIAAVLGRAPAFVVNAGHDAQARVLVKSMIEMAKGLGLETVAEWVGDKETAAFLEAAGVRVASLPWEVAGLVGSLVEKRPAPAEGPGQGPED